MTSIWKRELFPAVLPRWVFWIIFFGAPLSVLVVWLWGGPSRRGELGMAENAGEERIRANIDMLARTIGARSPYRPGPLTRAADHIRSQWTKLGYEVTDQPYKLQEPYGGLEVRNLEVVIPGRSPDLPCVVIGAHYDTEADSATAGADDNASGVALLLELSESLRDVEMDRTLRLVAFVCEEPPFFQTEAMGSLVYARALREKGVEVAAMVSLESLGYYSEEPGSQKYPAGLGFFYPSTGNFVGVVGDISSRRLVDRLAQLLIEESKLPVEVGSLPRALPGIGWSDHWAFWQCDYPAVMLTDTAPFRNPNYHGRGDTVETLDYRTMAALAEALPRVVARLASRGEGDGLSPGFVAAIVWLLLLPLLIVGVVLGFRRARRQKPAAGPGPVQ